jgi:hypothetical protein
MVVPNAKFREQPSATRENIPYPDTPSRYIVYLSKRRWLGMRDIAALVFGSEPGEPREPHEPREACLPQDPGTFDGPPRPTGDWCQTPPGRGTLGWPRRTLRAKGRSHRLPR